VGSPPFPPVSVLSAKGNQALQGVFCLSPTFPLTSTVCDLGPPSLPVRGALCLPLTWWEVCGGDQGVEVSEETPALFWGRLWKKETG
jgi:hypothetical protein